MKPEERRHREGRRGERQDDPEERLVAGRAIDGRRLLELLGDRVEVALQVPDRERQRARDDGQARPRSATSGSRRGRRSADPSWIPLSMMNSGAIVATAGSIRTPRMAIIRTSRPRNGGARRRRRRGPRSGPMTEPPTLASRKLLRASSSRLMSSLVGWAMTRAKASSDAPGGMRPVRPRRCSAGRAPARRSTGSGTGPSTVISRQRTWRMTWLPRLQLAARRAAPEADQRAGPGLAIGRSGNDRRWSGPSCLLRVAGGCPRQPVRDERDREEEEEQDHRERGRRPRTAGGR